jgi:hypothetical protein
VRSGPSCNQSSSEGTADAWRGPRRRCAGFRAHRHVCRSRGQCRCSSVPLDLTAQHHLTCNPFTTLDQSAPAMAIALADIGKSVREVLYGTPKEGVFGFDQKVTYATKTADGVVSVAARERACRQALSCCEAGVLDLGRRGRGPVHWQPLRRLLGWRGDAETRQGCRRGPKAA